MNTLEQEIRELKIRLDQLELLVERSVLGQKTSKDDLRKMTDEEIVAWLKEARHIVPPPPLAFEQRERWRTLSRQEREAIQSELDALSEGPMVSEIVIKERR